MNGRPGVSEATRERVRRAAEQLGWQPHAGGRALARARASRSDSSTRSLRDSSPPIPSSRASSPGSGGAGERGSSLLLRVIAEGTDEAQVYRTLAGSGMVDGFVLTDVRRRDPRPGWAEELGVPVVVLGRPGRARACGWIWIDDNGGVGAAVDHLVALGHRRIAHVSGPELYLHARARALAWRRALRRHGLPDDRCAIADLTAEGGAAATKQLLDGAPLPTAIVHANDLMAMAGMGVLAEAGLRVPQGRVRRRLRGRPARRLPPPAAHLGMRRRPRVGADGRQ